MFLMMCSVSDEPGSNDISTCHVYFMHTYDIICDNNFIYDLE